MALKLRVSNIACKNCPKTITESIQVMAPDAKVDVDVEGKTVTVESTASEESIKQVIVAPGYSIAGY